MSTDFIAAASIEQAWPCAEFFEGFIFSEQRVLLLDYDGTLAPFSPLRNEVFPYPMISELLSCIMSSCRTRVVLISGRSAREIPPLLGMDPHPEIRGAHGLERLHVDGRYEVSEIGDEAREALAEAISWLSSAGLSKLVEIKAGAVAIHHRGLSPAEETHIKAAVYQVLAPLAVENHLSLKPFDGGVELRAPVYNKGDVVRSIISEYAPDTPIAYLGDDTSDEDAFRALWGRGLSILVRPLWRSTDAQMWLRPPLEVVHFLVNWIRACGGEV